MERIFLISLSRITIEDFIKFFELKTFDPDWYNVQIKPPGDKVYHDEDFEKLRYRVFDLDHIKLGEFKLKNLSTTTIFTFYVLDNKYRQALLDYIQWTIKEMKLAGFTILNTEGFDEDASNVDNDNRPYLPKKEAVREKWREIYECIKDYLVELSDSDEDEIFVPKLVDIRSYIKLTLKIEYSTKTISRIIKAGEAGLLDKH